jgi:uncharacterized protein YbaR (Trm112 family)
MRTFRIRLSAISAVSDSNHWKIEHACPQCGAPVILDEADRLLFCPFCKTRLYLVTPDHFRYQIPAPGQGPGDRIYLPYWRLKGISFSVKTGGINTRFVDTSVLAAGTAGLPRSLGLRPQAMTVRYISPDMPGRFLEASLPARTAICAMEASDPTGHSFHRAFIGETVGLVYTPTYLKDGMLCDALLERPLSAWKEDETDRIPSRAKPPNWQIRFISTLCPHCGWDLDGERDAQVLICKNCNSAWSCTGAQFERVPFSMMATAARKSVLYLPFWRMKPDVKGLPLRSYADLIRLANLPKAISSVFETTSVYFWAPAFKLSPALFLRWARQMTAFQPEGKAGESFAGALLHPVTLAVREAVESMKITLAGLVVDKRQVYPNLADIQVSAHENVLVYHPFIIGHRELVHETMQVAIDRTALSFGAYL